MTYIKYYYSNIPQPHLIEKYYSFAMIGRNKMTTIISLAHALAIRLWCRVDCYSIQPKRNVNSMLRENRLRSIAHRL